MKPNHIAKLSNWGLNLGLRIPRRIVRSFQLKDKEEVEIRETEEGFEVIKIQPKERADNYVI